MYTGHARTVNAHTLNTHLQHTREEDVVLEGVRHTLGVVIKLLKQVHLQVASEAHTGTLDPETASNSFTSSTLSTVVQCTSRRVDGVKLTSHMELRCTHAYEHATGA